MAHLRELLPASLDPARPHEHLLVGLAAALACAVTVVVAVRPGAREALAALPLRPAVTIRAGESPPPRQLLLSAARAARREGATALPGRPVRYRRVMAAYLDTVGGADPASALVPETTETWVAADGHGEIRHTADAPIWPSAEDRLRWQAAGAQPPPSRTDHFRTVDPISPQYPSKARALARELRRPLANAVDADAQLMSRIRDVLDSPTASPALRAAALQVAATLRLTSFGAVRDQLGRPGYAVGIDSSYSGRRTRYEWIISRAGRLLEYQELMLEPAGFVRAQPPVQLAFEIQTARGWVAKVGTP